MKKFSYNQNKLDLLSNDISFKTSEVHIQNDYYGQASIIKSILLKPSKSLYAVFEHGVGVIDDIWHVDKFSEFKVSYLSSEFRKQVYKEKTKKYCFNVGNIIDYIKLPSESNYKKNGSIYFLSHSTHNISNNLNLNKIIEELNLLPIEYRPKYICIYWRDIQLGYHKLFIENGFQVVTAGHMYDKLFFYRLKEILLNFEIIIVSELGSQVFYAHLCGLKIIVPKNLTFKSIDKNVILGEFYEDYNENILLLQDVLKSNDINDLFIEIFNNESNERKINFLNRYSSRLNNKIFLFHLIHFFSWLVYKIKPNGIGNHLFDYLYIRLDKLIKRNITH